jgi:hypothetical protein
VHDPQCCPSFKTSLQIPAQHCCPERHWLLHEPQVRGSLLLTQTPEQGICPEGQAHTPPWHVIPPEQTRPQIPQLCPSVVSVTQVPAHVV